MGRLGWFFTSILIALAALFAGYMAFIFGYREQVVFDAQVIIVPDRWASFWISVVALIPAILIAIMRRHDRDNSGWDVAVISLLTLAVGALGTLGLLEAPAVALPIFVIVVVANIYSLIVLFFLPGDKGANNYGSREGHPPIGTIPSARVTATNAATPTSTHNPLEGTPQPTVTLTEQANGQRIPRSMFIGHTVGYLVAFTVLSVLLTGLQFTSTGVSYRFSAMFHFSNEIDFSTIPPVLHVNFLAEDPIIGGVLFAAAFLVWCDLIVRRRHDRNRSGLDGLLWLVLLAISQIAFTFDLLPRVAIRWLDVVIALGALYLFVVLVILPGNPHENRYGAVPRPD